jgi:hypothetical protein
MSATNSQKAKKSHKGRKSNATKLAHKKFRWFEQLAADPGMPLLALRACLVIGSKCSLDNGSTAIIGQDKIAEVLDAWRQDVSQAVRQAAALGHIEIIRRGRDHANAYRMVLKDEASASKTAADDVGNSPTSRPDMMSGNPDFDVGDSPTDSPFFSPGASSKPPGKKRERERASRAETSPSGGHPPRLTRGARQESLPLTAPPNARTESKRTREEEITERVEINPPAVIAGRDSGDDWRELRALWQRGHAKDDTPKAIAIARAAYERARRITSHEEIIAGAKTCIAAADAPRFLPPLADWLDAKGWTKPPPSKRVRPSALGLGKPRSNGNAKPDMFKICLEAGGYREDADGNMVWPGDDDEPISTSMWGGGQ